LKKRRIHSLAGMAIAFVILCGMLWTLYVQWKIESVIEGMPPETADVGIVLGASLWNDRPSPGLKERLDYALQLYREGKYAWIIVSGGPDHRDSRLTEAEGMKDDLVARGVPPDRVVLEPKATSTYENLLYSRRIMKERGWKRAIIVTHHYHGARAKAIAEFLGMDDSYVAVTDSRVLSMPWHRIRETLAYAKWELDKLLISVGIGER